MKKPKSLKVIAIILCGLLIFQQTGFAQVASVELNIAGHIASFHNTFFPEKFRPLHLRSISYDELNNDFKLLLDKGDEQKLKNQDIELTAKDLLNYFFVGIALPNDAFWVNLRPDSPNDIIDPFLAQTEVGKIFLEADLQLKKDAANATNPQTIEGKEYWDKLYRKAAEIYGTQEVTIPTLTRPWIVPDEVIIRESTDSAYVYKATLKVMLEQDYLKGNAAYSFKDEREKQLNEYSTQLIKEDIVPKLTKEINTAKRYAPLRQVYYSLILAQWFKARNQNKNNQYAERIDRKDLANLQARVPYSVSTYFNAYQENFAKGEYNIKAPVSTPYGQVIRSYFSGGISVTALVAPALGELPSGAVTVLPDTNAYLPKGTDLPALASANGEVSLAGPSAGQVLASPEETLDEEYARLNNELWSLDPQKDAAKLGPIKKRMREIDNKLRPVDLGGSSAGESGSGQGNGPGGMEKPEDAAAYASLPSLDELPSEAQQNVKNSIEGLEKDIERLENAVREFESASSKQMVMEDGSRRNVPETLMARLRFNFPGLVNAQTESSIPSITGGRSINMAEYLVTRELIAVAERLNKMMPDWLARIKNKNTAMGEWLSWIQMGAVEQQMSIIPFQSLIATRLRDQESIENIDQAFGKGRDLLIHSASPEVISKILERNVLASRLQQRKRFGEDVQSTVLLSNRAMPKGAEEELNQIVFGYNQWFTGYGAFAIILPARPVLANNQFSEWDGIHVFDLNNQGFAQDLFAVPFVLVAAPEGESEVRGMLQKYAERLLADNPDLDISSWVENHIKVLSVDSLKPTVNSSGVNIRSLSDQEQNEIWSMMQRQSNANTLVPQAGHFLPTGKRERMFKNVEQEQYIYHINAQQILPSPGLDKRVPSPASLNVAEGVERREDAARRNAIDRIKTRIEDYQAFEQLIGGIINKLEAGQPLLAEDISVLNEFKDRIILKNSLVALYLKTHPGDVIVVSNQPAIKFLNTMIGEPATNRLIELRQKTATRLLIESGLVRSEDKSTLSLLFKQDKFVIEAEVVSQLGSVEISKKLNWVAQRLSAELTEFLHREYKDNAAIQDFVFVSQFGASLPVKDQTDDAYILADIQALQAAKMARRLGQSERIFNYQELDSLLLQAAELRQALGLGREEMASEDEMRTVRGKTVESLELEVKNGAAGAQRQLQLKKYLEILDLFDYQKSWRPSPAERTEQAGAIFSVLGRLDRIIQNRDSPEAAVASLRKALSVIKTNPKNSKIVSGEAFLANAAKLLEEEDVVLIAMDVVGFWSDMQKHFSAAHQESMKIPVYRAEDGLRMSILILIADDLVKRKMSERLNALIKIIGEDIPVLNADGTDLMLINQEGGDEIVFAVRKHDWNALATKLSNQNLGVRIIANSISSVGKRPGQSDQTLLGRAYTNVAHDVFGEAYVTTQESDKKAKDLEKLGVYSAVISLEANDRGASEWFVYYKGKRAAYDEFLEKQIAEMKVLGADSKSPSADESGVTGSPSQPYTNAVARDVVRPLLSKGEEEGQLRILDVGSGSGITSVAAALFGGEDVKVTGLEPDKNNVDLSNRVKQYAGNLDREGLFDRSGDVETYVEELESSGEVSEPVDNVEFRVGSATLIPYADNSFNRIIYFDVNSFILKANDRAKAIQEILRVIDKKKGGLIHAHPKASATEKDLQDFIEAFNIEADQIGLKLEYRFTSSTESGKAVLFIIQPGRSPIRNAEADQGGGIVIEPNLPKPSEIKTPGGIDFRFLPIVTQSIGSLKASIKSIPAGSLQRINLTQEWADIQRLVNSGITPSAERVKEYFAASCFKGDSDQDAEKIVSCIANILRTEEESCVLTDPVLKDILIVLGSGRSAAELKSAFTI